MCNHIHPHHLQHPHHPLGAKIFVLFFFFSSSSLPSSSSSSSSTSSSSPGCNQQYVRNGSVSKVPWENARGGISGRIRGRDAYYREGNRELFIIATKCSWSAHIQNHFWTLREVVKKQTTKKRQGWDQRSDQGTGRVLKGGKLFIIASKCILTKLWCNRAHVICT